MSRIVFLRMDGDDQVEIRMDGDATWMEVTERFVQFLQGCGYQVTEEQLYEYFAEVSRPAVEEYQPYTDGDFTYSSESDYDFAPLTSAMKNWTFHK